GRDVDAVQDGALRAAGVGDAARVDDVELAVENGGVLDDRVQEVVVLLRADGVSELDTADPVLGREAGSRLLDEAARIAGRRAVDPVVRRLDGAVGVRPVAGAPANRRDDGPGRDGAVHAAAR